MTKERPIIFSASMVRAILDGRKTQTRRVVKPMRSQEWLSAAGLQKSPRAKPVTIDGEQWAQFAHPMAGLTVDDIKHDDWSPLTCIRCPYGGPGSRLWVRETWAAPHEWDTAKPREIAVGTKIYYAASANLGGQAELGGLIARSPRFMPRWASRITLEITGVRVERLQAISEADAMAEGAPPSHPSIDAVSREFGYADFPRSWYAQMWDHINGHGSWDANPWVWVIEFRRIAP